MAKSPPVRGTEIGRRPQTRKNEDEDDEGDEAEEALLEKRREQAKYDAVRSDVRELSAYRYRRARGYRGASRRAARDYGRKAGGDAAAGLEHARHSRSRRSSRARPTSTGP